MHSQVLEYVDEELPDVGPNGIIKLTALLRLIL